MTTRTPGSTHTCEYCGERLQYIGTDHDMDGSYVAEYWCDNCKEYLHYVLPEPPRDTEPDVMRADYRHFFELARHGTVTESDAYHLIHVCLELGRMGWTLNENETDWQPPQEPDNG